MTRAKTKTEVATIKLMPACRRAWEAAAERETRSLANMFEVVILGYYKRHHIALEQEMPTARRCKTAHSESGKKGQCFVNGTVAQADHRSYTKN